MPQKTRKWYKKTRHVRWGKVMSSTREVRGRIVHWQANEWPVLRRYTLSISSQIFQVLLMLTFLTWRVGEAW